jgi:very-short-patch-repair endonuclease
VFDDLDFSKKQMEVEIFDRLPNKAKEVYFSVLNELKKEDNEKLYQVLSLFEENFDCCQSPIEKIFMMSFYIICILRSEELKENDLGVVVFPQYQIKTDKTRYFADFFIFIERLHSEISVIVECDGHDFHKSTKQQVEYDNSRDFEIKKQGYDILRFSGSYIYKNPLKCANDVFDYLLLKEERLG